MRKVIVKAKGTHVKEYPSFTGTENTPLLKNIPRSSWNQHLAAGSAGLMTMSMGFVSGWSAFATPYLQGKMEPLDHDPINDSQVSWIASIVTLGALVGALPSGKLAQVVGRKWYLICLTVPLLVGWMLIVNSNGHVPLIYIGRFMCGIAFGGVTVTVPLYNNEIAEDKLRGKIGSYFDLMLCLGLLSVYIVGAYTSYFVLSLVCCFFPLIFLFTFIWMPESPYHLLNQGRVEDTAKALRWLRKGILVEEVNEELVKMTEVLHATVHSSASFALKQSLENIKEWNVTSKALVMAFGLMTFQRLSGVSAIVFYTVEIFRAANTSIKPQHAAILVGVLGVVGCLLSALLVDRVGRRVLLMYSGFVMALCFAFMSVYFAAADYGFEMVLYLEWIPFAAVFVIMLFFTIGLGPVPWFMMAELLPEDVQRWAISLTISYTWTLTFMVTKTFPYLVIKLGFAITYALMALVCAIGVLFVEHCIPETKNKSPLEIHKEIDNYMNLRWFKSSEKEPEKEKIILHHNKESA